MKTQPSKLTGGLDEQLSELPPDDAGDLKLLLMMLAENGVQIARTKALMNEMNARGMFDNCYVEVRDGQVHHYYSETPPPAPTTPAPVAEPTGRFLSSAQAARYLGLDVKNPSCTMSRLVKSRALPRRVKMNKLVFFPEELDAYMAQGNWKGRGRPPGVPNKPKDDVPRLYPMK